MHRPRNLPLNAVDAKEAFVAITPQYSIAFEDGISPRLLGHAFSPLAVGGTFVPCIFCSNKFKCSTWCGISFEVRQQRPYSTSFVHFSSLSPPPPKSPVSSCWFARAPKGETPAGSLGADAGTMERCNRPRTELYPSFLVSVVALRNHPSVHT